MNQPRGVGGQQTLTPQDAKLLARAVQLTRVSYFTETERAQLEQITARVTGWKPKLHHGLTKPPPLDASRA